MKYLVRALIALVGFYLVILVGFTALQRWFIYHPSPEIVAPSAPGVTAEHIRTPDGETLLAWYLPPQANAPMFLFFDGNGGRPQFGARRWRIIAEHGAGFLAVYYRGYSGSTGSPSEAGLNIDARAGYDWLIAHGYRAQDIVIHGVSLGSGVAVRLAAERPARALILEAPFTALRDEVAHVAPFIPPFLVRDAFLSRVYIKQVHMPVLIAHGDADRLIPIAQGERLFALANQPKTFVRIHGAGHNGLPRGGLYDFIWPFLAAHPPAAPHP